jgi:membrane-associated phospholipid phosphatase
MAVVGAFTLGTLYPHWIPALAALAVALTFSRVYLGVHYVGDVLGGLAYGLVWGTAWVLLVPAPA